jgi:anti-sigma factor RsiW
MTCSHVRPLLPAHVYGDLPDDQAAAVAAHLRGCASCRAEADALAHVRSALDTMPSPAVRVDVPALFTTVADRQARRWRRLALAGGALAASLLVVLGLGLRVTIGNGQLVLAWGNIPANGIAPAPRAVSNEKPLGALTQPRSPDLEDRIQLLQELARALATDIDTRDRQRQTDVENLRTRLDAVQQMATRQWADAERWVNALYVAQFKRPEEKANP